MNPITADALGHDWGDWVIDGDNHYRLCQRDGCEARDEAAHNYGNWTYVDENTCKGVCECGAEITDAHSGGTATCVKGPTCEKCGSEYGSPDPVNGHDWDTDWTWDDKEHWYPCTNEGCEAKLQAEAHTAREPEIEPGKPATCTEAGTTDETFCSVCGAPISEQEIIEPLGHQLTAVAKVEPSCTAPGAEAYWKCTRDGCGKLFSDADGKNEITAPVAIEALGHDWATELTKGETTHYYACSRCDERKDEAAHTGGTATCKAKAKCSVCGAEYGDFAEHVYPANVWWGDENEHWHVCNVCGQDSPHEAHAGGTATCTEPARCDACGNLYGEPLGHDYDVVARVDGAEIYECPRCKYRYTKKIANNTSEPLDDLVQDQAGQAVPYRMEAVDTPAGKAVVVTPYVDQSGQMANQDAQQIASGPTLCLTQEVVKKWLEEGFKFTWFVNGEATLEIELDKLSNFFDSDERFLFTIWSNGKELDLLVHALMATASVPVTDLNGLTLRIGDTTVDMTLDAEGKFTYTLVS